MSMTKRESTLAMLTLIALMVGSVLFLAEPQWVKFKDARERARDLGEVIRAEREFIARRDEYEQQDAELQGELPNFAADQAVDTHWLTELNRIARAHKLQLLKRDTGREEVAGNAREIAIVCREWQGTTTALINFLEEVQTAGSAMDVRRIRIRKVSKSETHLTGRFTVYCAYTRDEPVGGEIAENDVE